MRSIPDRCTVYHNVLGPGISILKSYTGDCKMDLGLSTTGLDKKMFLLDKDKVGVQLLSCGLLFETPGTAAYQDSLSPKVGSNSYPLSWWCHPTILSSVAPFSSCPQSFPASESFPVIWLFTSSGQMIGASASALVLSMNIHDWSPLGWTGCISLQSKGFSRV